MYIPAWKESSGVHVVFVHKPLACMTVSTFLIHQLNYNSGSHSFLVHSCTDSRFLVQAGTGTISSFKPVHVAISSHTLARCNDGQRLKYTCSRDCRTYSPANRVRLPDSTGPIATATRTTCTELKINYSSLSSFHVQAFSWEDCSSQALYARFEWASRRGRYLYYGTRHNGWLKQN